MAEWTTKEEIKAKEETQAKEYKGDVKGAKLEKIQAEINRLVEEREKIMREE